IRGLCFPTVNACLAPARFQQTRNDRQQRRLPSSVWSEQAEYLPFSDLESDAIERDGVAVAMVQVNDFQDRRGHGNLNRVRGPPINMIAFMASLENAGERLAAVLQARLHKIERGVLPMAIRWLVTCWPCCLCMSLALMPLARGDELDRLQVGVQPDGRIVV